MPEMTREEWLKQDVKIATANPDLPVIPSTMAVCYCGQPIVNVMEQGYGHATTGKQECPVDPRNDPPE